MLQKIISAVLALTLTASLAGCGAAAQPSTRDYAEVLTECRSAADGPDINLVTTPEEDTFGMMELYGLEPSQMERYALCISPVNLEAYALMIVLPTEEGRADVEKAMAGFIQKQSDAFRDYLPDQYAIAEEAKLVTTAGGELVLVMCPDSSGMLDRIETALKA